MGNRTTPVRVGCDLEVYGFDNVVVIKIGAQVGCDPGVGINNHGDGPYTVIEMNPQVAKIICLAGDRLGFPARSGATGVYPVALSIVSVVLDVGDGNLFKGFYLCQYPG